MIFSAYTGRLQYKAKKATFAVKLTAICSYLLAVVSIAFILIAMVKSTFENITILTSIASYVVSVLTIGFVELPRVIKPETYADQTQSRKNTLASRPFAIRNAAVKKP